MTDKKPCPRCANTGKADTGNGSTKPCDCTAGDAERQRRRMLRYYLAQRTRAASRQAHRGPSSDDYKGDTT